MSQQRKAILAGIVGLLGGLGTGLAEGGLSPAEIVGAALTAVLAYGGVFGIANVPPSNPYTRDTPPHTPTPGGAV